MTAGHLGADEGDGGVTRPENVVTALRLGLRRRAGRGIRRRVNGRGRHVLGRIGAAQYEKQWEDWHQHFHKNL